MSVLSVSTRSSDVQTAALTGQAMTITYVTLALLELNFMTMAAGQTIMIGAKLILQGALVTEYEILIFQVQHLRTLIVKMIVTILFITITTYSDHA